MLWWCSFHKTQVQKPCHCVLCFIALLKISLKARAIVHQARCLSCTWLTWTQSLASLYYSQAFPGVIPECRVRSKSWATLGIASQKKISFNFTFHIEYKPAVLHFFPATVPFWLFPSWKDLSSLSSPSPHAISPICLLWLSTLFWGEHRRLYFTHLRITGVIWWGGMCRSYD